MHPIPGVLANLRARKGPRGILAIKARHFRSCFSVLPISISDRAGLFLIQIVTHKLHSPFKDHFLKCTSQWSSPLLLCFSMPLLLLPFPLNCKQIYFPSSEVSIVTHCMQRWWWSHRSPWQGTYCLPALFHRRPLVHGIHNFMCSSQRSDCEAECTRAMHVPHSTAWNNCVTHCMTGMITPPPSPRWSSIR